MLLPAPLSGFDERFTIDRRLIREDRQQNHHSTPVKGKKIASVMPGNKGVQAYERHLRGE